MDDESLVQGFIQCLILISARMDEPAKAKWFLDQVTERLDRNVVDRIKNAVLISMGPAGAVISQMINASKQSSDGNQLGGLINALSILNQSGLAK